MSEIKSLEFPIMKEDEYTLFRKAYNSIKDKADYAEILLDIYGSDLKQKLNSVLSINNFQSFEKKEIALRKIVNVRKK